MTRRALKAMGIEDEKIDEIITMHTDTVDGLKADVAKYKADAEALPEVQKQLEKAQADLEAGKKDSYKVKYEALKEEFEGYKTEQTKKENLAAKETAAKAYYESKGITGKSLDIAIRGSRAEIDALELDGETIKDTSELDELVKGTFSGLVTTTTVEGANTSKPPANTGGGKMTKADIYKKDDHGRYVMSAAERQKALIENQIT